MRKCEVFNFERFRKTAIYRKLRKFVLLQFGRVFLGLKTMWNFIFGVTFAVGSVSVQVWFRFFTDFLCIGVGKKRRGMRVGKNTEVVGKKRKRLDIWEDPRNYQNQTESKVGSFCIVLHH